MGAYRGVGTSRPLSDNDEEAIAELQRYKDAGLTVYMPQTSVTYTGRSTYASTHGNWSESEAKRVFDLCEQVGLKVILYDDFIWKISNENDFSEDSFNTNYQTQESLVEVIEEAMSPYMTHPAFYGVMLKDEPAQTSAVRFGKIYKAIKEVCPKAYVHYNLYPEKDAEYYQAFIEAMGVDYLTYDQYPMYNNKIYNTYIGQLKTMSELAKKNGIDLQVVTQTFKMIKNNTTEFRSIDEADLYWLNNMLVGFGVKEIYYFTYYTKTDANNEDYQDGYSFINDAGETTAVYLAMQDIIEEMQLLAPVILEYDYNAAALYEGSEGDGGKHSHYTGFTSDLLNEDIITSVSVDNERALVTELKNAEGKYMYMLQNVADPDCGCSCNVEQSSTITFASGITSITVYKNGIPEKVTLTGNTYTVTQTAGQAVYIVID